MGTNFYLYRKLNKRQKTELYQAAILCDDYERATEILTENTSPIHIGKRSYGWKFLWDANNFKYFEPNRKSLMKFLKSGTIKDEYGEEFTLDEFMKKEIGNFLTKGYDAISYEKACPKERHYHPSYSVYELSPFTSRNIEINPCGEFYIGKLRFTVSQGFS